MILGDLDRRDAGPDFGQIEDRGGGRHGAELTWRGRRVHREIMARGEVCDSGRRKRRRALMDAARARLAELGAGFTSDKAQVEAMKADGRGGGD